MPEHPMIGAPPVSKLQTGSGRCCVSDISDEVPIEPERGSLVTNAHDEESEREMVERSVANADHCADGLTGSGSCARASLAASASRTGRLAPIWRVAD
jgi:hypothetical protein